MTDEATLAEAFKRRLESDGCTGTFDFACSNPESECHDSPRDWCTPCLAWAAFREQKARADAAEGALGAANRTAAERRKRIAELEEENGKERDECLSRIQERDRIMRAVLGDEQPVRERTTDAAVTVAESLRKRSTDLEEKLERMRRTDPELFERLEVLSERDAR